MLLAQHSAMEAELHAFLTSALEGRKMSAVQWVPNEREVWYSSRSVWKLWTSNSLPLLGIEPRVYYRSFYYVVTMSTELSRTSVVATAVFRFMEVCRS